MKANLKPIVKEYLDRRNMRLTSGQGTPVLAPVFIMDAQYQIFCKDIKPVESRRLLKMYKKGWLVAYNNFNKDFLSGLSQESVDTLCDIMDDFEESISNAIMVTQISVMNLVKNEPLERQKVIASCMVCNILAQSAQLVYKSVFENSRDYKINPHISGVEHYTMAFLNEYHTKAYTVRSNEDEPLRNAVLALCHKITEYINKISDEQYDI